MFLGAAPTFAQSYPPSTSTTTTSAPPIVPTTTAPTSTTSTVPATTTTQATTTTAPNTSTTLPVGSTTTTPNGGTTTTTTGESGSITASINETDGTVTGTATGYKPGADVTFTIASTPTVFGTGVANANGVASATGPLPADIVAGTHTVSSSGTGLNGGQLTLSTQVFVSQVAAESAARNGGVAAPTTAAGSGPLARTGSDFADLVRMAVFLVALGGGVVLLTRWRRSQLAR